MHFGDTIVIFVLALILFGPKKLPEIGRQIAKLLAEFRRASNEFKLQIDDELRSLEQQERQKQIAAEAAATAAAPVQPSGTPTIQPPSTGEPVSAASPYAPPDRFRHEEIAQDSAESRLEGPAPDLMAAAAEAPVEAPSSIATESLAPPIDAGAAEAASEVRPEPLETHRNGAAADQTEASIASIPTENAHHHG